MATEKTLGILTFVFLFSLSLQAAEPEVTATESDADAETRLVDIPYFENGKFKGYTQLPLAPDRHPAATNGIQQGETLEEVHPIGDAPPADPQAGNVDPE